MRAPADERFAPREGSALRSRIQGGVGSGAAFLERRAITPGCAALSAAVCAWCSISKAFRIPLLRGRGFAASDDGPAPRVAIISAAMAKRSFPDGDALGRRIEIGRYSGQWVSKEFEGAAEVIGIAGDRPAQPSRLPRGIRAVFLRARGTSHRFTSSRRMQPQVGDRLRPLIPQRILEARRTVIDGVTRARDEWPITAPQFSRLGTLDRARRKMLVGRMLDAHRNIQCAHTHGEMARVISRIFSIPDDRRGCIVEAGCFKGGSTANLSIAAAEVGRKLVVFDSFDGFPEDEEPYGRMWKEIGGPRPVIDRLGTEKLITIMKPPH